MYLAWWYWFLTLLNTTSLSLEDLLMALSDKSLDLLKQIYARERAEELVREDPDEALEYVLDEIVKTLANRHHNAAPLYMVMEDAVGGLRLDREERQEAKTS